MNRIFRSLAPYWKAMILVFLLLLGQAWCDLELPQYTSNIIDVGIINGGVHHIFPEALTQEEFLQAQLFMTDEEKAVWNDSYTEENGIYRENEISEEMLDQYDEEFLVPILMNYQMSAVEESAFKAQLAGFMKMDPAAVQEMSLEDLGQMAHMEFTVTGKEGVNYVDMRPILAGVLASGMAGPEVTAQIREAGETMIDTMGSQLLGSMGVAYAKQCHEQAGISGREIQNRYLWNCCLRMLGIALLMAVCAIGVGYLASRIGAGIGRTLREKVFQKVVSFTNGEMDNFSTASLITRTTNDVQQVQMVCVMLLRMCLYAPIIGIGGIIKVANTGAGLGWIIGLVVILLLGLVMILMTIVMPRFKIMQTLVDRLNLVSREILTGLSVIRAFGREKGEEARFDKANRDLMGTQLFTGRVMSTMMPAMNLIMNGMSIAIIWFSAKRIDLGTMQVGMMTAFLTYSMQIVMSFLMLTMLSIMLPRAAVAAGRIDEVIKTEASIRDPENPVAIENPAGVVRFDHVCFRYPGAEEDVLSDIDFTAEPGKMTAIIGGTGSGKSTLVNLIPRLYDVREGSVTIDGVDIRDMKIHDVRDQLGYVPQKGILFSGTIASNLRYGAPDASDEEIAEAARIAQAEDFILEKENGYKSSIAQGGSNVSGGQKQRLAIARAIARKPKVLIFDDSFSALDMKTDAALRRALMKQVKDSTMIVVAQRISTILHADQILVLDDGKIVGKGTHEELLKSCAVYRDIASSQLSAKELGLEGTADAADVSSKEPALTGKEVLS